MNSGKWRIWLVTFGLFAVATGCSLEVPQSGQTLEIKIDDQSQAATNSFLDALLAPGLLNSPSATSDFSCYVVNITGTGVPQISQELSGCSSGDQVNGTGFGLLTKTVARGQTVSVDVPAGTQRAIDVYGIYPALPSCGGSASTSIANGYFLGRAVRDLVESAAVTITTSYSGASSNFTCVPPIACFVSTSWTNLENSFNSGASIAYKVGQNASGDLLAVGMTTPGAKRWIIRKSPVSGTSWTTVDDFSIDSAQDSEARGVARDAAGNMYAVGYATDSSPYNHWIVRKSSNGGASWTTVDTYQYSASQHAQAYGIAIRESAIYVVGVAMDSGAVNRWIVRKSTDGGSSWTNIDDYRYSGSINAIGIGITVSANGHLYAVGQGYNGSFWKWVVRRSTDGGGTWAIVDDFQLNGSGDSYAKGVIVSTTGEVFVVGTGVSTNSRWVVRKSSTGDSGTWSTVDSFEYEATYDSFGESIIQDGRGNIYASGGGKDSGSTAHWIIRKSENGGATWTTVDDHQKTANYNSYAGGLFKDQAGALYSAGLSSDISGQYWTVRRAPCL